MDNFIGGAASRRLAAGAVTTQPLLGNLGADVGKICSLRSPGKPFFFFFSFFFGQRPRRVSASTRR